jgi:hypothetical protein
MALALDGAHESSGRVHRIDGSAAQTVDAGTDDERTVVEGMDDLLIRAAEGRCLLSDLDAAPTWTAATEPYDLTNYEGFPQQFTCK